MKRNLFLLLVSMLFILILIYFYDQKEQFLNKRWQPNENINVEYPYFNRESIDRYIHQYLNSYLDKDDYSLFIDYDYFEEEEKFRLLFYIYEEEDVMIKESVKEFLLDVKNDQVLKVSMVKPVLKEEEKFYPGMIRVDKPMIALTFDDGPNHNTNKILDILEKYQVKATFFILGCNILNHEEIIKRMNDLNMEIGNHMYTHKLLTRLKNEEIKKEVKVVDEAIFSIIGRYPTLIRPSYGTYNKRIQSILARPIIIWNIDTLDWKYHSSKNIYKRVMRDVSDGDIILMHDIYRATANSLDLIIPKLLNEGYQFVTVSELLYYKDIKIKDGVVYHHANK